MNRKIVFRGECINTGNTIYGLPSSNDVKKGINIILFNMSVFGAVPTEVVPNSVGEWTGLTYVKGNDIDLIFDGDILESFDSNNLSIKHLVKYNERRACFEVQLLGLPVIKGVFNQGPISQSWVDDFSKTVIGNKYNNPELLKQ